MWSSKSTAASSLSDEKERTSTGSSSVDLDLSSLVCQEIKETRRISDQEEVAATLSGMKRKHDAASESDRGSVAVTLSREAAADRFSSTSTSEKDNSTNEGEDSSDSDNNMRDMSEYPDRDRLWLELLAERPEDTEGKSMVDWLEKVVAASEPSSEEAR